MIKALASSQEWLNVAEVGKEIDREYVARQAYVDRIVSFEY